jgi:hypothetical protein
MKAFLICITPLFIKDARATSSLEARMVSNRRLSGDIVRGPVKKNIVFEDLKFLVPGERGQEIRTGQAKEIICYVHAQRILIVALRELFDDGEKKPDFTGREIPEVVGHVPW